MKSLTLFLIAMIMFSCYTALGTESNMKEDEEDYDEFDTQAESEQHYHLEHTQKLKRSPARTFGLSIGSGRKKREGKRKVQILIMKLKYKNDKKCKKVCNSNNGKRGCRKKCGKNSKKCDISHNKKKKTCSFFITI